MSATVTAIQAVDDASQRLRMRGIFQTARVQFETLHVTPGSHVWLSWLERHLTLVFGIASQKYCRQMCSHSTPYELVFCCCCSSPPQGSALYQRLIVLGRGAMAYGKFSVACECFEAAGAPRLLSVSINSSAVVPLEVMQLQHPTIALPCRLDLDQVVAML